MATKRSGHGHVALRLEVCLLMACGFGCTQMPAADAADDLSALARRYEHPTAQVPDDLVRVVLSEASQSPELARQLDGLRLVHGAVIDAAARLAKEGDADALDLQGTVDVEHTCPGFDAEPATAAEVGGAIRLTLTIEHSMVRRGVNGSADGCRFPVKRDGGMTRVELDAALTIDLGADTRIGTPLRPELLVRLSDLSADIDRDDGDTQVVLQDQYHFRVSDTRIETLVDMSLLGLPPLLGSAVVVANDDGSMALRERRGEWHCVQGEDACELVR